MEHVSWDWVALGLLCITVFWLPGYLLNKIDAKKLLKESEEMRIRRKREDILYEFAICATDIPNGDPRWCLMLNRAKESDEEMHKAFPKEDLKELAPLVRQYTLIHDVR